MANVTSLLILAESSVLEPQLREIWRLQDMHMLKEVASEKIVGAKVS